MEDEVNDRETKIGYKIINFHKIKNEDENIDDIKIGKNNIAEESKYILQSK